MRHLFLLLLAFQFCASAQIPKPDKKVYKNIKDHISFLADDKLEGRRTGSAGEKLAADYISKFFKKEGLSVVPGLNGYLQPFEVNDGRHINPETNFIINGVKLELHKNYFPLAYSGNGSVVVAKDNIILVDTLHTDQLIEANKTNPHFDLHAAIIDRAALAKRNGKSALIVSQVDSKEKLFFDKNDKRPQAGIPIICLDGFHRVPAEAFKESSDMLATIQIEEKKRVGHNVIGYIDNNAPTTVVLGAHYDHLGFGEDKNSLYTGDAKMIHNGADDNASGTAALIELARLIKRSKMKNNNYLFVAFSGEELGLFGSKYFVENIPAALHINFMVNMDMLGRLNDSTRGLTIGGYGTSPYWNTVIKTEDPYFKIKLDSSGSGPSDHTSFYRKDIPVLFFFTGTHKDYHKPSDDADKVNYAGETAIIQYIYHVVARTDGQGKLAFTKTREAATMGASSFRVTLGIMPDYTFSGSGVFVDGVSDNRPAQKAGIKAGDVVTQLGDHKFSDVQSYMSALNKFNKGERTKVKVMRGKDELVLDITF